MTLQESLHQYFGSSNCRLLRDNPAQYRCEKKTLTGKIYQITYIDESDKWLKDDFIHYLDETLRDDYYQLEGQLQWNLYYYFISTSTLISQNSGKKISIEKNEVHARKYILTEGDFKQLLLDTQSIVKTTSGSPSDDLYTRWINILRESKLRFVYTELESPNFKAAIEDFIANGPSDEETEDYLAQSWPAKSEILTTIASLNLLTFRKYPLQRNFTLAQVNLINGPNAAGKTSFFDALELIITGQAEGSSAADYKLEFIDDSGSKWSFPDNNAIYKQRDIFWYKSAFTRGHNLNGNFNKFNYYASDAAYLLKHDDDGNKNDFQEAVAHIALGREVNRLEERINGFKFRFDEQLSYLVNEEERITEELRNKNEQVEFINQNKKDSEPYKQPLLDFLDKIKWNYTGIAEPEKLMIELETGINIVSNSIDTIKGKSEVSGQLTSHTIKREIEQLLEKQNELKTLRQLISNTKQISLTKENEKRKILTHIPAMAELQRFYRHEHHALLLGLTEKLSDLTNKEQHLKAIQKESNNILGASFLERPDIQSKQIGNCEQELNEFRQSIVSKNKATIDSIKEIENGITELSAIISHIESLGMSYLSINPDALNCPLCNTSFEKGELIGAISKTKETFINSLVLRNLQIENQDQDRQLADLDKNILCLDSAKRAAIMLDKTSWSNMLISNLFSQLNSNNDSIRGVTDELVKLNILQSGFVRDSITEDRVNVLLTILNREFKANINSPESINSLLLQEESNRKTLENELVELNERINQADQKINQILAVEMAGEESLSRRLSVFMELDNLFSQIAYYMSVNDDMTIFNLSESLANLRGLFEVYKRAYFEAQDQTTTLRFIEIDSNTIIGNLNNTARRKKNAEYASTKLSQLMKEANKDQFLQEFFSTNQKEIMEIFRMLHSPREFIDIQFQNKRVSLVAADGSLHSVNEISTGQRSALALSLFLSLNKNLSNGPNIILMDDPVAYVDDVNMLSFLDYLRELTIQTGRQIFFATANTDLAFLFRKKFEFLGTDHFQTFNIYRTE